MEKVRISAAVALLSAALSGSVRAQPCASLDESVRSAFGVLVTQQYGMQEDLDCGMTDKYASQVIIDEGRRVVPCLLHIYRNGLTDTVFWPFKTAPPREGEWVLPLVDRIDPSTAVQLYRERYKSLESSDPRRLQTAVALANHGEEEYLALLTEFLDSSVAGLSVRDAERRQEITDAIEVVGQQDYKPALGVLQRFEAHNWPYNNLLPVYVAQLSEDVEALKRYATASATAGGALQALPKIGRLDVLQQLASDPQYRYRSAARDILERGLESIP